MEKQEHLIQSCISAMIGERTKVDTLRRVDRMDTEVRVLFVDYGLYFSDILEPGGYIKDWCEAFCDKALARLQDHIEVRPSVHEGVLKLAPEIY